MKKNVLAVGMFLLVVVGCTTTQKGTSVGTLTGATIGGIIGHQSGKGGEGAAIGAAAGALGGYIVGDKMKSKFCSVCGRQYDETVVYCPIHGVELQYKQ